MANPLLSEQAQASVIAEIHQGNVTGAVAQAALSSIPGITPNPLDPPATSTAITLIATQKSASQAAPAATASLSPASALSPMPGVAVIGRVTQPLTQTVAQLIFNVAPSSGAGFAQSISESYPARETLHQTATGFYVDQFGVGPGDFTIAALVVFQNATTIQQQIKSFLDILRKSKGQGTPINPSPSPTVLYTNAINGRKLTLTIKNITFAESAERPNIGTVNITGDILYDYAYSASTTPTTAATKTASAGASSTAAITSVGSAILTALASGTFK